MFSPQYIWTISKHRIWRDIIFRKPDIEHYCQIYTIKQQLYSSMEKNFMSWFLFEGITVPAFQFSALSSQIIFGVGLINWLAGFQLLYFNRKLTHWKIKSSTQQKILVEWTNSFPMHIVLAYDRSYILNTFKDISEQKVRQCKLQSKLKVSKFQIV